eukprot:CAMPEP_0169392658 /NCGR_PEP_ID=MMETSP1017-20121227/48869_1 /TAXON_ID=342587 /ORGANISM="Karlodinium micrum, Strain CCMP2283" /LENGTH=193 /DNA_ID=CAMNT_0009495879 /DNA_START=351 /DNA_END=930 /DNA_ORIENTATION=-
MTMSTTTRDEDPDITIVQGLTCSVKVALVFLVFLPQAFMTCLLCWLGCRWMTATSDLGELLLNAVALEFVLLLKENLYKVLVPKRSKQEMQSTYVMKDDDEEKANPSVASFFCSFLWGVGAALWVLVYISFLQHVLVDYQWDISDICQPYLVEQRLDDGYDEQRQRDLVTQNRQLYQAVVLISLNVVMRKTCS